MLQKTAFKAFEGIWSASRNLTWSTLEYFVKNVTTRYSIVHMSAIETLKHTWIFVQS